jgi:hypothetical protein
MAQIGTFTRNDEDGSFSGSIKSLSLNITARFVPAVKDSERSPELRAFAGTIEIGAGWKRTASLRRQGLAGLGHRAGLVGGLQVNRSGLIIFPRLMPVRPVPQDVGDIGHAAI